MLRLHVVLIQADADIGRIDLHQFAERILHPPADGNGAAKRGVVVGQFLAAERAGRIDAGAGFVDDHVGDRAVFQFVGHQFGQHLLRLAASRAVAQGHDGHIVLLDQLDELGPRLGLRRSALPIRCTTL